jgi:hypothetical protein
VRGDVGQEELTPEPKPPPAAGDVAFAEVVRELIEGGLLSAAARCSSSCRWRRTLLLQDAEA